MRIMLQKLGDMGTIFGEIYTQTIGGLKFA
jgi:hypothetical protein